MKPSVLQSRSSKKSGFTLIELLVVMAIISILAAILFEVGSGVINEAKRVRALALANEIQTAVKAYDSEYGFYPVPTGTTTDYMISDSNTPQGGSATWNDLLIALCGNINPVTNTPATSLIPNTKAISFLSLKKADVDPNNTGNIAQMNPLPPTTSQLFFNIAIDSDYDNILGVAPSSVQLPNFPAAVIGTDPPSGGTASGGVAIWANCNGNNTTKNPIFWIKTY